MTSNKHFKALVRARAARTGERYTEARDRLLAELKGIHLAPVATIEAHDKHCIAVRFTNDGRELLTGGFGGQLRIWSTRDWTRIGDLVGHSQSVNGFGLDSRGCAVTVSSDGTVRLWDLADRREIAILSKARAVGMGVDIRGDGMVAATGGTDGTVRFHRLGDATGTDLRAPLKIGGRVMALAFEPNGDRLVVSTFGGGALILAPDGSIERRIPNIDSAVNVRWSPDGAFILLTTPAGAVCLVETAEWSEVRRIEVGKGSLMPIALSHDGALIALGWERHLGLWRADEDDPAVVIDGLPKGVYTLDFSPDGRLLAQGGADGRVRIWRVRTG